MDIPRTHQQGGEAADLAFDRPQRCRHLPCIAVRQRVDLLQAVDRALDALRLRRAVAKYGARAIVRRGEGVLVAARSEEHTSELQSLMRISYAVFCLKKKKQKQSTIRVI